MELHDTSWNRGAAVIEAPAPEVVRVRASTPTRAVAARRCSTVLLVDERPIQRSALAAWLCADPMLEVIGKTASASDAEAAIAQTQPDAVLFSCDHPAHPYVSLASRVHLMSSATRVVMVSGEHSPRSCRAAALCGASAHVSFGDPTDDLLAALRSRAGSATPAPSRCVALEHEPAASAKLSPREREVLIQLARGLSAKQAAAQLGICPKTVDNHTQRMMRKLDLHSRADVVLFAVREGYVTP